MRVGEEMSVDVLVVGGGPAGTAAAIAALKSGRNCLLVEKEKYPRLKLCGGLMTVKARMTLLNLLGEERMRQGLNEWLMSREQCFSLWWGGKPDRHTLAKDTTPRGYERMVEVKPREDIWLIDRVRFDAWMARTYEEMGGTLVQDDGVVKVDFEQRVAVLGSGLKVRYGRMVAADGANSMVARKAQELHPAGWENRRVGAENGRGKRPKRGEPAGDVLCLEVNVAREDCPDVRGVEIFLGVVPNAYAWAFAKGDTVCLGLAKLAECDFDVRHVMLDFMRHMGVQHMERYPLRGAMLPFGNMMQAPSIPAWGILFVGDAAGLVEPLTGEGIYFALQSGAWAGALSSSYLLSVCHLQHLIRDAQGYQRFLMGRRTQRWLACQARKHPGFIEHFYSVRIEQGTTDSFFTIVRKYLKERRRH